MQPAKPGAYKDVAACKQTMTAAGSFGRTMEDLVMLDSVMRTPNTMTDELGGLPIPVSCDATIDRSMNLTGLKLGLPSNFGWVNPGLSGEVSSLYYSLRTHKLHPEMSFDHVRMDASVQRL